MAEIFTIWQRSDSKCKPGIWSENPLILPRTSIVMPRCLSTYLLKASPWDRSGIFRPFMQVYLKVLTNKKRGGLKVATFDRSPFKLFSLKFSAKSVKALSCERLKTIQRTLFLSFEIKNCFPITVLRRSFMTSFLRRGRCNSLICS